MVECRALSQGLLPENIPTKHPESLKKVFSCQKILKIFLLISLI